MHIPDDTTIDKSYWGELESEEEEEEEEEVGVVFVGSCDHHVMFCGSYVSCLVVTCMIVVMWLFFWMPVQCFVGSHVIVM